ncbi:hypothetical protein GCM10007880_66370 [Mesorhizobium amorphae]|nr:hypothetical protein GCM10007880_66370 [Mesorhizobium amorphae]
MAERGISTDHSTIHRWRRSIAPSTVAAMRSKSLSLSIANLPAAKRFFTLERDSRPAVDLARCERVKDRQWSRVHQSIRSALDDVDNIRLTSVEIRVLPMFA